MKPGAWLHKVLKLSHLGYASLEHTITPQQARIANLKDGDTNMAFFHHQCSYHRQKNRIHSFMVGDQPTEMAEAAFAQFDALLGMTVDRDCTLNLQQLIDPSNDLAKLNESFFDAEIWAAVKRLPARKAPGLMDSPQSSSWPVGPW
jgi:hypothetical protein